MQQSLKILLLEDSRVDAEIIQRLLLKEIPSCEVHLAMNRKSFLQALEEIHPDVILSDNSLPQFNATEALKIVRQQSLHIPFILVTGTVSEEYAANIIKQGADDYILKDRMARLPAAIEVAVRYRETEKEKTQAAERLYRSEENLKAIFDNSSEGFILLDEEGQIKTFNALAASRIFDITAEEMAPGRSIFDFIDPERSDFFKAMFLLVLKGEVIQYDRFYRQSEDAVSWINFSFNPVRKNGAINGVCITARDITERKIAEQQIEFDHNNLNALINNTHDLMWSVDSNLRLVTSNQAFDDAVKLVAGATINKGDDVLKATVDEEQLQRYQQYYQRAMAGEVFTEVEFNALPVAFWSEISFYPIIEKKIVIGTACFSRNITERRKAEEELRRLEQERLERRMEEQKRITRAILSAQEKERNAIGAELHDNVNQILVGTNLMLVMVKNDPAKHMDLLAASMEQIKLAMNENRKIAHVFVAPDLEVETLVSQLKKLFENMLAASGVALSFETDQFEESVLDSDRKFNIYRIAQEQCTNIVKHAKATMVGIILITNDEIFQMIVSDNGTGMDACAKTKGIGLRNINTRLGLFNGSAKVTTAPGEGFTLEVTILL